MFREIKKYLVDRSNNAILFSGIVHVGAHMAEELDFYEDGGAKKVLWIEANPEVHVKLQDKFIKLDRPLNATHTLANICLSDKEEPVDFYITSHTQSSSMLPLHMHSTFYPNIVVDKVISTKAQRFDDYVRSRKSFDITDYDFLCVDVQGAELKVLRGFGTELNHFNKICIEVNTQELYKGGTLIEDLDKYLAEFNFKREVTIMTEESWGEALYVK